MSAKSTWPGSSAIGVAASAENSDRSAAPVSYRQRQRDLLAKDYT